MTRSHRRRLVVPAVAAALALPTGLLAACSSGQLAETSLIAPAVPGAQASVTTGTPDETIQISNATVDFNGPQGYQSGDNAPLSVWIFNNTPQDITLTGVQSASGQVLISDGAAPGIPSVCQNSPQPIQPNPSTGAPTVGVAPSVGASGGISPAGPTGTPSNNSVVQPTSSAQESASANPTDSSSALPSTSASAAAAVTGSAQINVTIKSDGCVALTKSSSQFLQVANLSGPVRAGMTIQTIFIFQQGGRQFTIGSANNPLQLPVNTPSSPDQRAPAAAPAATE
ncbi:hypothetical protein GCM10023322_83620 [Rugosimonospora acidiphila]|uniref:Uncharacterized protein n=1 Tax=Rugosimonospora acidiphila TaxID=556531 RepID=A0ABP9SWV0_9ACTN